MARRRDAIFVFAVCLHALSTGTVLKGEDCVDTDTGLKVPPGKTVMNSYGLECQCPNQGGVRIQCSVLGDTTITPPGTTLPPPDTTVTRPPTTTFYPYDTTVHGGCVERGTGRRFPLGWTDVGGARCYCPPPGGRPVRCEFLGDTTITPPVTTLPPPGTTVHGDCVEMGTGRRVPPGLTKFGGGKCYCEPPGGTPAICEYTAYFHPPIPTRTTVPPPGTTVTRPPTTTFPPYDTTVLPPPIPRCTSRDGHVYYVGDTHSPDPCTRCRCDYFGERCMSSTCFPAPCRHSVTRRGACCTSCPNGPDCMDRHNNMISAGSKKTYADGEVCECPVTPPSQRDQTTPRRSVCHKPTTVPPTTTTVSTTTTRPPPPRRRPRWLRRLQRWLRRRHAWLFRRHPTPRRRPRRRHWWLG